jgi:hypothetical protein
MDTVTEEAIYDQLIAAFARFPDRLLRKLYVALRAKFDPAE